METVDERRVAAILGAVVADAAVQPLHWNYDTAKLDKLIGPTDDIAFWEPSVNPFYCIQTGKQSGYGDQALVILRSLVKNKGLDIPSLKNDTYTFFGPESEYENPVNAAYKDKSDVKKSVFPIKGPWRHFSVKKFIANYKEGMVQTGCPDDDQIDGVLRIIPVVAMYAGQSDMLNHAEDVVRITQESDFTVVVALCAARILEHFILNGASDSVVEAVIGQLEDPHRNNPQELDRAMIGKLRQLIVHGVIAHTDYATAVKATARAGGCNCSRAGFIGACLAAQYGVGAIPDTWKEKTLRYQENISLTQQLCRIATESKEIMKLAPRDS